MIDLTTYALLRKQITSAVSGVSDVRAEGDELIFVLEDGREVRVAIPATEIRDAVVRDDVLVLTLEDDKEVVVDATLTQSGQAADAKVTGEAVRKLKDDLHDLVHNYNYTLEDGKYRYINSWYGDGYYNWESPGNFIKSNAFWRTEIFNLSDIESFTINKDSVKFLVVYFDEDNNFKTSFSSTQNSGYTYVFDASNNKSKAVIHIAKSTANITDVTINGHYKISVGVKNEDKLKLIYKAKALGGDVDDDVAIQNYINNEKYVYIPKGEYFFNKTVHVKRYGTTIIGEGMGMLTTIRPYDDNCTALFNFNIGAATSQMYTMQNICLRMLNHDNTTNNGKGIISDKYIIDGVIENCWFNGGRDEDNSSVAIDARLINTRITNCLFECFGTAIKNNDANTSNASSGYIISDCIIWNCVNALDLQGAGIVSGCNIKLRNGFAVKTSSYGDVDVSDCRVYDMDIGGINSTLFESNGSSRLFCDGIYVGETSRPLIFDCKDTSELKIYNYHEKAQFKGSGNYITDRNEQMLVYEKITSSDSTALQDSNINNYKEVYYILKNDTAIESNTNIPLIKITTDSGTKTAYGVPMNTKNAFISIKWTGLYYIVESVSYNDGYGSQNRRENIIDGISGLIKGIEINFNGAKINADTTVKMFKVQ